MVNAPNHIAKKKVANYIFTSAHLWQNEIGFAKELINEMKRNDQRLSVLSSELEALANSGKRDEIMKRMSFSDGQFVGITEFINPDSRENRKSLYAVYSLALHGDPFAANAHMQSNAFSWHFLLAKTLQLMIAFETARLMPIRLRREGCKSCENYTEQFNNMSKRVRKLVDSNTSLLNDLRR